LVRRSFINAVSTPDVDRGREDEMERRGNDYDLPQFNILGIRQ